MTKPLDSRAATKAARRFRPSRRPPVRDMETTAFGRILGELLLRVPGAYAAVLVDRDGEAVDYAGLADPFDLKVAAAHLRILLHQLAELRTLGGPRWLVVRSERRTMTARQLPEDYAIVVLLRRRAGFTASSRAFAVCERALAEEAGWPRPGRADAERARPWHPVEVEKDGRGRPVRMGPRRTPVVVLGAVMGLPPRERGFRVRTAEGTELTLIREAANCWYVDDPVEAGEPPANV